MTALWFRLEKLLNYPSRWEETNLRTRPVAGWGYLPAISIFMSFGVVFVALSNIFARNGSESAMQYFWIGLALMIVPMTVRLVSYNVSAREAIGMLIIFSIASFSPSYMRSPIAFKGFDEALHWRTAIDILYSGHLFTPNSMLPVSPLYPGLENVTTALVNLSGLSIFEAALVVLVFARLVMILSLYFLYFELSGSIRAAGIATLVYAGSSTFMYFETQFGYESLALPLILLCLYMLLYRVKLKGKALWVWNLLLALMFFSVVATHHMTTYAFIGILILWILTDIFAIFLKGQSTAPIWAATLLVFLIWVWVGLISTNTLSYLAPILNGAVNSFYGLIAGQSEARQLFQDSSGESALLFERVVAILAVLLLGLALPIGLWQWWLRYKKQSLAIAFMVMAVSFPLLPIMRLSGGAWDLAHRASGFVFIGLAFVVAIGVIQFPLPPKYTLARQVLIVSSVCVVFIGGVVAGVSAGSRLDQPYRPASGQRSVDNQAVMAAEWARLELGPNHRMAADRTMTQVMGSYGVQRMITDLSDRISISGVFLSFSLTPNDFMVIRDAAIRYLVVDSRIATVLSTYGYYFEAWEQLIVSYTPPVSISVLQKFDHIPSVSRIYDSGSIVIYDIGTLIDGQP